MKMPKAIKRKWLRALRSGTYKQAKHRLYDHQTAGFCCLGVLQHCVSGGMVEMEEEVEGSEDEAFSCPSTEWYDKQGIELQHNYESYHSDDQETKLMRMNDSGKKSFKFIADWIEKNIQTTD